MSRKYAPLATAIKPLVQGIARLSPMIWPPVSLISRRPLAGPGLIESKYWKKLRFITPPLCDLCGVSLPRYMSLRQVCGACHVRAPVYDRARSALIYGEVSRDLVLTLKWSGQREGLSLMAGWMAIAGEELLADTDILVPVPLHYWRLVRRGYNQSVWLAEALHRQSGLAFSPDAMKRTRPTPSQGRKSSRARQRNVAGAFAVRDPSLINQRRVLLIDDVLTTGATLNACARTLKQAGAKQVDALTLARVDMARNPST